MAGKRLIFRLDDALHQQLVSIARNNDTTVSKLLRVLVRVGMDTLREQEKNEERTENPLTR